MLAGEMQPVLRTLRNHGIHVVALHNHMVGEKPPFYFMHYWGTGPAQEVARAFKAALDAQPEAREEEGHEHGEHREDEGHADTTTWHFDDISVGNLPDGWQVEATHPDGKANPWSVREDSDAASFFEDLTIRRRSEHE